MADDVAVEEVPQFIRRLGDRVIEGSNNALLVLGTDRPAGRDSGHGSTSSSGAGKGAGTIHAVVGRSGEDPDLNNDKSYIYLSMQTDADNNLGLGAIEFSSGGTPAALMKSDCIRLVARRDLKIVVGDSYITIRDGVVTVEGASIKLGKSATEHLVKESFLRVYDNHAHDPNTGRNLAPSNPSLNTTKTTAE
jgi:hypothetical protein